MRLSIPKLEQRRPQENPSSLQQGQRSVLLLSLLQMISKKIRWMSMILRNIMTSWLAVNKVPHIRKRKKDPLPRAIFLQTLGIGRHDLLLKSAKIMRLWSKISIMTRRRRANLLGVVKKSMDSPLQILPKSRNDLVPSIRRKFCDAFQKASERILGSWDSQNGKKSICLSGKWIHLKYLQVAARETHGWKCFTM